MKLLFGKMFPFIVLFQIKFFFHLQTNFNAFSIKKDFPSKNGNSLNFCFKKRSRKQPKNNLRFDYDKKLRYKRFKRQDNKQQDKKKRILILMTVKINNKQSQQVKMDVAETHEGPKTCKFTTNDCQVEVSIDEFEQQLKMRVTSLKNKNVYESVFDDSTLPEELKIFLSNIKTVYEYIDVNKEDNEKVIIEDAGLIHLVFVLSFGPTSQIKKEIVLSMQLKEVGSVEGSNIKQHFDKLREEMIEMNKKNKDERQKLRVIILTVQKTTQKLVCQAEELKLDNIDFKKKMIISEQKINSLEILLKDLYTKFETLKEEKELLEKKMQQTKLVAIVPPNMEDTGFKKEITSILHSNEKQNEDSFLRRIKALQEERDQERKLFQQKLAQKQKKLSSKVTDIELKTVECSKQANSDVPLLNSYLKDSDIQKLRNTVSSPYSSGERSDENKNKLLTELVIPFELQSNLNVSQTGRKVGLTGKYYCGGKLCTLQNCPKCKGPCGPNSGENCMQCMKMDIQKRGLKKGFLVNGKGQVSWMENSRFSCGIGCQNGAYNCGINQKYCQWCQSLTENYEHRYKELL